MPKRGRSPRDSSTRLVYERVKSRVAAARDDPSEGSWLTDRATE